MGSAILWGIGGVLVVCCFIRLNVWITLELVWPCDGDFLLVTTHFGNRLIRYQWKLSFDYLLSRFETWMVKSKKPEKSQEPIPKTILHSLGLYKTADYFSIVPTFIHCEHFYWKSVLGTEDAAATAWATGALWSGTSLLLTYLASHISFERKPIVQVRPVFHTKVFSTEFRCIFRLCPGNLINVILMILKVWLRRRKVWRNIRSKG